MTSDDVEVLKKINEFDYVSGILWLPATVEYNHKEGVLTVQAIPTENADKEFRDLAREFESGKGLAGAGKYSADIGYKLAKDYFDKEIKVNSKITIQGKEFRVVGIFKEQGDQSNDYSIIIPLEAGKEIFNKPKEVSAIIGTVKEGVDVEKTKTKIIKVLKKARGEEDFIVVTPAQIQEQISNVLSIVRYVLIGIAAISLLVGAIGILNVMYTSVLERTKEIGVMKAIGARNSDILGIFLVEAGFIGLVGGVIGVLVGLGMAKSVELIAGQIGFISIKVSINYLLIGLSLAFTFIVGILAGVLPALKAAKLKPAEALRYE